MESISARERGDLIQIEYASHVQAERIHWLKVAGC